jgi:hypothetical protein
MTRREHSLPVDGEHGTENSHGPVAAPQGKVASSPAVEQGHCFFLWHVSLRILPANPRPHSHPHLPHQLGPFSASAFPTLLVNNIFIVNRSAHQRASHQTDEVQIISRSGWRLS